MIDNVAAARAAFDDGLRPDLPMLPSEWGAERRRGLYDPRLTPYCTAPLDALGFDDPCEAVAVQMNAQGGKTWVVAFGALGYYIDHAPCDVLLVEPSLDQVRRLVREKLDPMIAATPALRAKVATKRAKDASNSIAYKEFPGGSVALVGANSEQGFKMTSRPVVIFDEIDDYPTSVAGHGDVLLLGQARQKTFLRTKRLFISTPTIVGLSRIVKVREAMERGHVWYLPCPRCGAGQDLVIERLRYVPPPDRDHIPEVLEDVWYQCVHCDGRIEEAEKPAMLDAGWYHVEWDRGERTKGYRVSGLAAPFAGCAWGRIAAKWERSAGRPAERRVVVNTDLGLPFAEQHDTPDWAVLYARREFYELGVVPVGARVLTAFADCQKDRLEVEVRAWGRRESWPLWYEVLPGDIETDAAFDLLDVLLARDWPCAGGGTLPIMLLGIDHGHWGARVAAWARRHRQPWHGPAGLKVQAPRTVACTKGRRDDLAVYLHTQRSADGDRKRGVKVYSIGTVAAKLQLYQSLRLTVERGVVPPGYLHLPNLERAWFQQLVAEKCITVTDQFGRESLAFTLPDGLRNEAHDCAVGNLWCAAALGLERFTDAQWTRLEAALPPGLLGHPEPPPAPPTPAMRLASLEPEPPPPPPVLPTPPRVPVRPRRGVVRSAWMTRR